MDDVRAPSILLVEDDHSNLVVMAKLFRAHGFTVHSAPTAQDAVSIAAAERCDLMVCDLGLPDRDGADLMRELKAVHGLRGLALSGHTGPDVVREAAEAGFERHLAKPVIFDELVAAVRTLLDRVRVIATPPTQPSGAFRALRAAGIFVTSILFPPPG